MDDRSRDLRYASWAGTVAELKEAAERSAAVIEGWKGEAPKIHASVTTPEGRDGAPTLAILDGISPHELGDVEVLKIRIGDYGEQRVELTASKRRGLEVEIYADDQARVEGLTSLLNKRLRHGKQRWDVLDPYYVTLLVALLFAGGGIGVLTLAGADPDQEKTTTDLVLTAIVVVTSLVATLVTWAMMPNLELLQEGEKPIFVRWRWRVGAFAFGIVGSIIATAIAAAYG